MNRRNSIYTKSWQQYINSELKIHVSVKDEIKIEMEWNEKNMDQ